MLYCFDKKLNFDYSKREMALSKINHKGILYDGDLKIFTDFFGNQIDISGKRIFPRTGFIQVYEMNDEIVRQGGIPAIHNEQVDMLDSWPEYYHADRKVRLLKGKDLINLDVVDQIEHEYGQEIFIKTREKNFSGIISTDLLRDSLCAFYRALEFHLDDEFIISEKVDVVEDNYGLKEYRCFVVDNQIYNISRFTTDIFHPIEESILQKALEVLNAVKGKFPSSYVVDLFEYKKNGSTNIDVVEFNPVHCSGLYLYNSVMEKSDDLLHTNLRSISREFIDTIDECRMDGHVINDRENLYQIPNGFSNDLRSICLIGERGLLFAYDTVLTVQDFAKHSKKFDFQESEPITDEDLFSNEDSMFDDVPADIAEKLKTLLKREKE